jgi:hypothetical protein
MSGAPMPPARPPQPYDALLDAVALVEARELDDVAAIAALLANADLPACARVLDSLLAHEMLTMPFWQVCILVRGLSAERARCGSPAGMALTLAEALGARWGEEGVADKSFRRWAISTGAGQP